MCITAINTNLDTLIVFTLTEGHDKYNISSTCINVLLRMNIDF